MYVLIEIECFDVNYFKCIIPRNSAMLVNAEYNCMSILETIEGYIALIGVKWSDKTVKSGVH